MSNGQLKAIAERIERLMDERDGIQSDIRDIYAEAKSAGFVPKVLRKAITRKRMDPEKRDEEDTILDLYEGALSPTMRKVVAMAKAGASSHQIEAETGVDHATVARSVALNKKSATATETADATGRSPGDEGDGNASISVRRDAGSGHERSRRAAGHGNGKPVGYDGGQSPPTEEQDRRNRAEAGAVLAAAASADEPQRPGSRSDGASAGNASVATDSGGFDRCRTESARRDLQAVGRTAVTANATRHGCVDGGSGFSPFTDSVVPLGPTSQAEGLGEPTVTLPPTAGIGGSNDPWDDVGDMPAHLRRARG